MTPIIIAVAIVTALAPRAWGQADTTTAPPVEHAYEVSSIAFESMFANLPDLDLLSEVPIQLGRESDRFGDPASGEAVDVTLDELFADGPVRLTATALDIIAAALVADYADQSGIDVFICPAPRDIDPVTGADLRATGVTALTMSVVFDGPRSPISEFVLSYATPEAEGRPDLEALGAEIEVSLYRDGTDFVGWRPGAEPETMTLASFSGMRVKILSAGATQSVLEAISRAFMERQFMGTYVRPGPNEFATDLSDLRGDRTTLEIMIFTSSVSALRTLASGDRVEPSERIDHPYHDRVRRKSPFQPPSDDPEAEPPSMLRKDVLDDYLYLLSRHPGRRVDAAVAPGLDSNTISLDYIVTERRPWTLYYQISNTGTEQTGRWRNRFGAFNNQLTNNDDILNLEYVTPDFRNTNTLSGVYDARVGDNDRLRWRVNGFWSEYVASEVGFANESFTGESWGASGELDWNFYQDRQLFADVIGGARYLDVKVRNDIVNIDGTGDFLIPYVGVRLERFTEEMNTAAVVTLEASSTTWTGVDQSELNRLGRLFPDEDFVILKWDLVQSMYLEPLLNRDAWLDLSTPQSSTLAHEVAFRFRGQYAFDNRLIPQLEQVMGGLYSVRGYPESVAVGDTALVFNAEYRFHLPRAFAYEEQPGELFGRAFRWKPQQPYGRADWDLILKAFFDIGRTMNSNSFSFESDETLMGTGIGLEFTYKTNAAVRLDWGIALKEIPGVESGSSRLHVIASLFY